LEAHALELEGAMPPRKIPKHFHDIHDLDPDSPMPSTLDDKNKATLMSKLRSRLAGGPSGSNSKPAKAPLPKLKTSMTSSVFAVGDDVEFLEQGIMRDAEDSGMYISDIPPGQRMVVQALGTGPTGRRLKVFVPESRHAGWISCCTSSGSTLIRKIDDAPAPPAPLSPPRTPLVEQCPEVAAEDEATRSRPSLHGRSNTRSAEISPPSPTGSTPTLSVATPAPAASPRLDHPPDSPISALSAHVEPVRADLEELRKEVKGLQDAFQSLKKEHGELRDGLRVRQADRGFFDLQVEADRRASLPVYLVDPTRAKQAMGVQGYPQAMGVQGYPQAATEKSSQRLVAEQHALGATGLHAGHGGERPGLLDDVFDTCFGEVHGQIPQRPLSPNRQKTLPWMQPTAGKQTPTPARSARSIATASSNQPRVGGRRTPPSTASSVRSDPNEREPPMEVWPGQGPSRSSPAATARRSVEPFTHRDDTVASAAEALRDAVESRSPAGSSQPAAFWEEKGPAPPTPQGWRGGGGGWESAATAGAAGAGADGPPVAWLENAADEDSDDSPNFGRRAAAPPATLGPPGAGVGSLSRCGSADPPRRQPVPPIGGRVRPAPAPLVLTPASSSTPAAEAARRPWRAPQAGESLTLPFPDADENDSQDAGHGGGRSASADRDTSAELASRGRPAAGTLQFGRGAAAGSPSPGPRPGEARQEGR